MKQFLQDKIIYIFNVDNILKDKAKFYEGQTSKLLTELKNKAMFSA
jgi:hypothetical protein